MCQYVKDNKCSVTGSICPFVFFCKRTQSYRPSKYMPEKCKVAERMEKIPKGYYKVRMERKGYLYVDIRGQTYKILNPFDDVPQFVKATKLKDGSWKLRK